MVDSSMASRLAAILLTREGATFAALAVTSWLKFRWLARVRGARERLFRLVGRVSELHVYPFKACGATSVQEATATLTGLSAGGLDDRWWMLTSPDDKPIQMKEVPRLTQVRSAREGSSLVVSAPDMTSLRLPAFPDDVTHKQKDIQYHGASLRVLCAGDEADAWFSRYTGKQVHVYHCRPGIGHRGPYTLPLPWETGARPWDSTFFAYLTGYLLTTTASLADVNSRLDSPIISLNFRPNIVVENSQPFEEDDWEEIRIGETAKFHYVQPCLRCTITTIDPDTAKKSKDVQPLKELKKYRQRAPYGNPPVFGAYISIDCEGEINVGDPVYAITRKQYND